MQQSSRSLKRNDGKGIELRFFHRIYPRLTTTLPSQLYDPIRYFIEEGYAVVFLYRKNSLQPYSRHFLVHQNNNFLDYLCYNPNSKSLEIQNLDPTTDDNNNTTNTNSNSSNSSISSSSGGGVCCNNATNNGADKFYHVMQKYNEVMILHEGFLSVLEYRYQILDIYISIQ